MGLFSNPEILRGAVRGAVQGLSQRPVMSSFLQIDSFKYIPERTRLVLPKDIRSN